MRVGAGRHGGRPRRERVSAQWNGRRNRTESGRKPDRFRLRSPERDAMRAFRIAFTLPAATPCGAVRARRIAYSAVKGP
jgi:hypothetical protein